MTGFRPILGVIMFVVVISFELRDIGRRQDENDRKYSDVSMASGTVGNRDDGAGDSYTGKIKTVSKRCAQIGVSRGLFI